MENEDSKTPQNQKLAPLKKVKKPDKPTARLIEEKSRLQREIMIITNSAEQEMWGEDKREDTKMNIFHQ